MNTKITTTGERFFSFGLFVCLSIVFVALWRIGERSFFKPPKAEISIGAPFTLEVAVAESDDFGKTLWMCFVLIAWLISVFALAKSEPKLSRTVINVVRGWLGMGVISQRQAADGTKLEQNPIDN